MWCWAPIAPTPTNTQALIYLGICIVGTIWDTIIKVLKLDFQTGSLLKYQNPKWAAGRFWGALGGLGPHGSCLFCTFGNPALRVMVSSDSSSSDYNFTGHSHWNTWLTSHCISSPAHPNVSPDQSPLCSPAPHELSEPAHFLQTVFIISLLPKLQPRFCSASLTPWVLAAYLTSLPCCVCGQ